MNLFYNPSFKQFLYTALFLAVVSIIIAKGIKIGILFAAGILGLGLYLILKTQNKGGIAHIFAGYIIGGEVFFRMAGGVPFDYSKYSTILLLGLALLVDKRQRQLSLGIILYMLLLLPAIYLSFFYFPMGFALKANVILNILGPITLFVSTLYFFRFKMTMQEFVNLSRWIVLGVFATSIIVLLKVGDYSAIQFTHSSNGAASGGFSGNQVSIAFGIGVMMIGMNMVMKNRLFYYLLIDLGLLFLFIFQGLMTFSRGGMASAILAVFAGAFLYYFSNLQQLIEFFRKYLIYLILGIAFSLSAFIVVDDMTGGFLYQRYFNVDKSGKQSKKDLTTGRGDIVKGDLMLFEDSSYVGVGVGVSKYVRPLHRGYAPHVEYSRMLADHGILGAMALIIMFFLPLQQFFLILGKSELQMIFGTFMVVALLTMTHAAMRLGMVGFFYGLAFIILTKRQNNA